VSILAYGAAKSAGDLVNLSIKFASLQRIAHRVHRHRESYQATIVFMPGLRLPNKHTDHGNHTGPARSLYWLLDPGMKTSLQFHEQAEFLRESSGSTNIEKTLIKAVKVFALFHIPHYVCDGFAVQELGYPRFTVDVDIIVPDVQFTREKLCLNGFKANPGFKMTLTDRETKVEIDLLPGGGKVGPGPLPLPMPTKVSHKPQILTLTDLISAKLSSYIGNGAARLRDAADVSQLIQVNHLPRDYHVDAKVRNEYYKLWDDIHSKRS